MDCDCTDERAWKHAWRRVLQLCATKRIFAFDLDGTIWQDILVVLNEAFGPVDQATGEKKWREYDRAFKILGTMSNGAHLEAEYRDLLTEKSLGELTDWLKANHELVPGVRDFLKLLSDNGITPVAISNGAFQIAEAMLDHHDLIMPSICNALVMENDEFFGLDFVHDEHDGIRKGDLIKEAARLGYKVVGCAGDSKGDIGLATETARLGGLVIAVGNHGLSDWLAANQGDVIKAGDWIGVSDFADAISAMKSRIAGNSSN
jgi:2-hydroxy-3-keto-5-methylthiopentenyl-1-phosphate phosphatase